MHSAVVSLCFFAVFCCYFFQLFLLVLPAWQFVNQLYTSVKFSKPPPAVFAACHASQKFSSAFKASAPFASISIRCARTYSFSFANSAFPRVVP